MTVVQRKIASAGLIASFFIIWELICLMLGISDLILPRPTQIVSTLIEFWPGIAHMLIRHFIPLWLVFSLVF